jgi:hypothetical protein
MKTFARTLFFAATLVVVLAIPLFGQSGSINNTLGPSGAFNIKDGAATFLTLSQATGYLSLNKSLALPATTDATLGIIFKDGDSFMHNYQGPGTNGGNTFVGMGAGNFTMSGTTYQASYNSAFGYHTLPAISTGNHNSAFGYNSLAANTTGTSNSGSGSETLMNNTTGYANAAFGTGALIANTEGNENSACGSFALYYNTTGDRNSAFGTQALQHNTEGTGNCAFGYRSLSMNNTAVGNSAFGYQSLQANLGSSNSAFGYNSLTANTSSYNSAFGYQSLKANVLGYNNSAFGLNSLGSNTNGGNNSAFGVNSLDGNTSGNNNCAFGTRSLHSNTIGDYNSAFGCNTLDVNTTGISNSAFGLFSLNQNTTGNYNTAIGRSAGLSITTGSNNTAVGYNAQVPDKEADNQVRIGNASITYAGVQVAWTVTSDRRWKDDIQSLSTGLDFVSQLRPVSYTRKNDQKHRTEYGFIAQEVEQVLKDQGIQNSGMLTIDEKGFYELRYNDLLAPMVKAMQELQSENESLKKELTSLRASVAEQVRELRSIILKASGPRETSGKTSPSMTSN